jgi:hypothetical protein
MLNVLCAFAAKLTPKKHVAKKKRFAFDGVNKDFILY